MIQISTPFIASQIVMAIVMGFDFLSFQFKKREHTIFCFMMSSLLIGIHYFLLGKITAGAIALAAVIRYIVSYFTTDRRVMLLFIALNVIILAATYREPFDFIAFIAITIIITATFQTDNKSLRRRMMAGTTLFITYNAIILSPMGIIVESWFLMSNLIGYHKHFIKK